MPLLSATAVQVQRDRGSVLSTTDLWKGPGGRPREAKDPSHHSHAGRKRPVLAMFAKYASTEILAEE